MIQARSATLSRGMKGKQPQCSPASKKGIPKHNCRTISETSERPAKKKKKKKYHVYRKRKGQNKGKEKILFLLKPPSHGFSAMCVSYVLRALQMGLSWMLKQMAVTRLIPLHFNTTWGIQIAQLPLTQSGPAGKSTSAVGTRAESELGNKRNRYRRNVHFFFFNLPTQHPSKKFI